MAKPRVFISSTFYDLKQIRLELDRFLSNMGYESIRNEVGNIPYGKEMPPQTYCYKEINTIDILICIIGGRFGSQSNISEENSVTQQELKEAQKAEKQIFLFIDKDVATEFETYLLNKDNQNIHYRYVDDIRVYKFLEDIRSLNKNNIIQPFSNVEDITSYLREQFAGMIKQHIIDQKEKKEYATLSDINNTAKTLRELVEYLNKINNQKDNQIQQIVRTMHPIVKPLKEYIGITYNIYIDGKKDLDLLFRAYGYTKQHDNTSNYLIYTRSRDNKTTRIEISDSLFDESGSLKYLDSVNWKDEFIKKSVVDEEYSDLPF